jgi:hypothetical protein
MPVIRPVACLDKLEIIGLAEKIGTYETSILPFEDCCTLFVPRHPVINPKLNKCIEYEKVLNYDELIDKCIDNIVSEIKKIIYKEDSGYYYGHKNVTYSDKPLRSMITKEVEKTIDVHKDLIIELAAEKLADKLSRTKVVKERAAAVAEEVL